MHGQLWLCLARKASGLKVALTGKSRGPGAKGTPCCFLLSPLSLLIKAAPPAWPQPHGRRSSRCSSAGCCMSFCPPQRAFSGLWSPPWRATLLRLRISCLPALSELDWTPAWWRGTFFKAQVLSTKLWQCDSVQDLAQHFCSQWSESWPGCVWLIAWLPIQGRTGERGATFILILKALLLPTAPVGT